MSHLDYVDVIKSHANSMNTCDGQNAHYPSNRKNPRRPVMKTIVLLCALAFGFSGMAYAAPNDPQQSKPPVDCKKNPTDPSCKAKK
jgi:hypothetical protein